MFFRKASISLFLLPIILRSPATPAVKKTPHAIVETTGSVQQAVLWKDPVDIKTRDLYYGPGGKKHQPATGPYTFIEEDMAGSNPKYVVRDKDGVKWKLKLGAEAQPETAATRLVWAAGYFANEDYFLPEVRLTTVPPHLHRGQNLIGADGTMHNVRLKRYLKGEKKLGNWSWAADPFNGTRPFNGLRVMMALINNWDLKDENTAIYEEKKEGKRIYIVSDLGASFGTPGADLPQEKAKGNLQSYMHSTFIRNVSADSVDFTVPARPSPLWLFKPPEFIQRRELYWIGKDVPRADARWLGQLLARLSFGQIRDAFRAAGYAPMDADGFAQVVENRIVQLCDL